MLKTIYKYGKPKGTKKKNVIVGSMFLYFPSLNFTDPITQIMLR